MVDELIGPTVRTTVIRNGEEFELALRRSSSRSSLRLAKATTSPSRNA